MFAIPKSNKPNQTFKQKEKIIMSSKNTNKLNVPEARAAMNKFKMEAANEVGVNLKQGYNGDLTSREAGSVGGQMVKNDCPVRPEQEFTFTRVSRVAKAHEQQVTYRCRLLLDAEESGGNKAV